MTSLLPPLPSTQASPAQVLPLFAVVFPEFTQKRQTHHARNNRMANNTFLNNLPGKLLEITLQDSLDGLEDFTLQIAYAATSTQFEILFIGDTTDSKNNLPTKPTPLTLVNTSDTHNNFQSLIRRQRRV